MEKTLAIGVALILSVGLAACGSDSDSGSGGDSSSPIEGKKWELMNIASQGSATSLPNTVEPPTVEFEDGNVQVFGGCNSGSGPAEVSDSTISFGAIAMTKKSCDGLANQIESYVSQVLNGDVPYKIEQGSLVIGDNSTSLIFTDGK